MHKIKKFAAEHKREIIFAAIYLLMVVFRFSWFYTHETAIVYRDSQDYLAYDPIRALQGSAVNGRAPVYGTILYLIRIIVGEWHQLHAATFLQELVGIAVLPLFSATLRRVGVGTRVRAAVLLLYGFCPAVYGWDNVVLTESLSLSATVVFFFLIVRYIQERRFWDGAGALLVTVWLIFLRPQFLTYLAMLMVFFVWRMFYADKKEKKDLGILLALGAVAVLGIIVYCASFSNQFGIFSMTDAGPRQDLRVCVDRGYYKDFADEDARQIVEDAIAEDTGIDGYAVGKLLSVYGNAKGQKLAKDFFRTNAVRYIKDTCNVMWNYRAIELSAYGLELRYGDDRVYNLCLAIAQEGELLANPLEHWLTLHAAYILSLLWGVVMVIAWVQQKRPPWLHMALFALLMCTTFLTFFITCGEYMRTMITVVPYMFICMGMAVQRLIVPHGLVSACPKGEK